ncbi:DNA-binding protein [Sansalvadorimonas sp. 2012CJ34-2]|uniref:DNA-binding protein n=1 Tax=Parendozoicomonas callyspongiae TaxID=2942213 RepID=A0ABT0PG75_9GAMM|nr:DNA-binding protein [Sansalvadorimonas sp. 2012CJ34-2]MCL6270261.1 DNA-binding protein [Sansalvadorimonas sp. 2012CJ34-2]
MAIEHLSQKQLAQRWGVKTCTLERWRQRGIGPLFLKINSKVMYRLEDVESYENAHHFQGTGQPVQRQEKKSCQ